MNVIDLFCGAGGLSYGFEQAGFKTVLGVDINPSALMAPACSPNTLRG